MRALSLGLLLVGACNCSGSPSATGSSGTPKGAAEVAAPSGPPLAEKDFYRLDVVGTPVCNVNASCDVKLALTAIGKYHINEEYPTKFVPDESSDFAIDGKPAFTIDSAKRGTMSIKVKPTKAGALTLSGQFRLGVCTDEQCEIDGPKIQVAFTAS